MSYPVIERFFAKHGLLPTSTERLLGRHSDALLAVSPIVRRDLLETFGIGTPDRFRVVPLGFDLSTFVAIDDGARAEARAVLNIDPDAHVIATVGRLTAIKQLRARGDDKASLPVIVVTADTAVDLRERCLATGADDVILKPVAMGALLNAVGRMVARNGRQIGPAASA